MLKISTTPVKVKAEQEKVYAFFADVNNLKKLMPAQVENWQSDTDSCSFSIKGMADIGMRCSQRIPHTKIEMVSDGKAPFDFVLHIEITVYQDLSEVNMHMEAQVNSFMKMFIEEPLTKFFQTLSDNLPAIFSA